MPDHGERQVRRGRVHRLPQHAVGDGGDRRRRSPRPRAPAPADLRDHARRGRPPRPSVDDAVGQRPDPLRLGHEQVGGERARRHRVGEPARGPRIGREGVRGPAAVADGLGHALEPHQRRVGIGRQRERRRHDREDVRHDLAQARRRVHHAGQHVVGARGRGEPQPAEQLLGRRAVARRQRPRPGERLEQRPVEQPLVQLRARVRSAARTSALERPRRPSRPERSCDRPARVAVGREVVGLEVADDLEPVLEPAQEPVRIGQRGRVGLGDVSLGRERGERREGVGARADPRRGGRARSAGAGRRTPRRGSRPGPASPR